MKKFLGIVFSLLALLTVLSACASSLDTTTQAEESQTDQGSSSEAEDETLYDYDEAYDVSGVITLIDQDMVTVRVDFGMDAEGEIESGTEMIFDIQNAETYDTEEYLMTGAGADVQFIDGDFEVYPALAISVTMDVEQQADAEGRDPVMYGTVQFLDDNTVTIIDETGIQRDFNVQLARIVSFESISAGDEIAVTYFGSVFDHADVVDDEIEDQGFNFSEPLALKLVSMDALDSEEANENYLTGTVGAVYSDAIELETSLYTFVFSATMSVLDGINEEDHVRVYYEPPFGGITVTATRIELEDEEVQ